LRAQRVEILVGPKKLEYLQAQKVEITIYLWARGHKYFNFLGPQVFQLFGPASILTFGARKYFDYLQAVQILTGPESQNTYGLKKNEILDGPWPVCILNFPVSEAAKEATTNQAKSGGHEVVDIRSTQALGQAKRLISDISHSRFLELFIWRNAQPRDVLFFHLASIQRNEKHRRYGL